ncbi:MAG: nitrilase-related carbon-nitrogen hydrolase, partial [Methylococcales bacterium]|nr:nitrilase-related carbon-nitrogen hydrolase [Methylococcales bacterium]
MPSALRLLMAQINPTVGAIEQNAQLILEIIQQHAKHHDLILFPELALCGYPPEDLLFNLDFHQAIQIQLNRIKLASQDCHVVIGHPELRHKHCFNAASVFFEGKQLAHYHKQALPNYGVFDEKRYFTPGEKRACVLTVKGHRLGVCICEDLWAEEPIKQLQHADIQGVLSLNASPFELGKYEKRISLLKQIAKKGFFIAYANLVGGQDELIFDGQSLLMDAQGQVHARLPAFDTAIQSITLTTSASISPESEPIAQCYQALCLALK